MDTPIPRRRSAHGGLNISVERLDLQHWAGQRSGRGRHPHGYGVGAGHPIPAGTFTDLFMLGAMVNNINAAQTFTVTYTDGTDHGV